METFETVDLGTYRGDDYFLVGYVVPKPDEGQEYDPAVHADNYGWSLVRKAESPLNEATEIVRLDDYHGKPHMDKEYLPPECDEERKVWLHEGYSFSRMRDFLLSNWRRFADLYIYHNE